jgi:hypothetical protein
VLPGRKVSPSSLALAGAYGHFGATLGGVGMRSAIVIAMALGLSLFGDARAQHVIQFYNMGAGHQACFFWLSNPLQEDPHQVVDRRLLQRRELEQYWEQHGGPCRGA